MLVNKLNMYEKLSLKRTDMFTVLVVAIKSHSIMFLLSEHTGHTRRFNRSCKDVFTLSSRQQSVARISYQVVFEKKRKRRLGVHPMNKVRLSQG